MNNQELARKDYESGMKYKDIAAKYDIPINTVKSWKKRNNWLRNATKSKKLQSKTKKVAPEVVQKLVDNDELTDKRKMFCLYYLQRFNATWAYMKAYGADYETSKVNASKLLTNANVQKQIKELKKSLANELNVTLTDIAKQYASQAFSDIGDYIEFGTNYWVRFPITSYNCSSNRGEAES